MFMSNKPHDANGRQSVLIDGSSGSSQIIDQIRYSAFGSRLLIRNIKLDNVGRVTFRNRLYKRVVLASYSRFKQALRLSESALLAILLFSALSQQYHHFFPAAAIRAPQRPEVIQRKREKAK